MSYPNALDAFVNKIDNFDDVKAVDINELQNAIMAAQQFFGTQIQFGWLPLSACTYVSATSFTLEGDWTNFLKIGAKFKCTNSTLKYGYVLSSSYSSGTGLTTVNLVANASYALASAAISGAYISYANPPEFPVISYIPIITASGGVPPTYADKETPFSISGRKVSIDLVLNNTSGGTPGSGEVLLTVSVPIAIQKARAFGIGLVYDANVAVHQVAARYFSSTTIYFVKANGGNIVASEQAAANRYIYASLSYHC
jgi:hypothetical protein